MRLPLMLNRPLHGESARIRAIRLSRSVVGGRWLVVGSRWSVVGVRDRLSWMGYILAISCTPEWGVDGGLFAGTSPAFMPRKICRQTRAKLPAGLVAISPNAIRFLSPRTCVCHTLEGVCGSRKVSKVVGG